MGLHGDFLEVGKDWKAASPAMKLWLTISTTLATASIASLSEAIIKWRQFFRDFVIFYTENLRNPTIDILNQWLGWRFPSRAVDTLILLIIIFVSFARIEHFRRVKNGRPFWHYLIDMSVYVVMIGAPVAGIIRQAQVGADWFPSLPNWAFATLALGYIGIFGLLMFLTSNTGERRVLVSSLFAPFIFVAIAAAVNAGLTRQL